MSRFYNLINKKEAEEAELYIEGEIVDEGWEREFLTEWFGERATASSEFTEQLKSLNGKPLKIHCNSCGGSLFAGTAMYCALVNYKGKKTGYIGSMCASSATFPMLACDKTYMTSASGYCAHLPMVGVSVFGNKNDLQEAIDEVKDYLEQIESVMVDAYKRKTGMSAEKIRNILAKDEVLSASKAIELGFVDGYVEDEPKYDKAFIENIFKHNVMVYNSIKSKFVKNEEPPAQEEPKPSITIDNKVDNLKVDDEGTFTATLSDLEGDITWATTDDSIISINVSTGEYKAIAVGEAVISASVGEYSDSMTIVVSEEVEEPEPNEPDNTPNEYEIEDAKALFNFYSLVNNGSHRP